MSKLFCFLLTVVMVAALLGGCGNPSAVIDGLTSASTAPETTSPVETVAETSSVPAGDRLSAVTVQFSDGGQQQTQFAYDAQGNLTSSMFTSSAMEEAQTTSYSFDENGRLLSVQLNGYGWDEIGPKAEYTYDEAGLLTQETQREGGAVTYVYRYDDSGRCLEKTCEMDFFTSTSQYSYSEDGLTVEETIRSSDQDTPDTVVYTYDAQGHLLKEAYTGLYYSYTYLYDYTYAPFVLVSSEGEGYQRLFLSDPTGHSIWEIDYFTATSLETDETGLLTTITTDSGTVYRFLYE